LVQLRNGRNTASAARVSGARHALHFILTGALVLFLLVHVLMVILAGFRSRMRAIITGRAGIYGWVRHKEKQQEAEYAAYTAKMKPIWDCEARNDRFSNAKEECEKDPSVVLQPITITPTPTERPKPFGDAQIVPDVALLFGCESSTLITTLSHGNRVKVLSDRPLGRVKVQISDGRIGCLLEGDEVQRDRLPNR
jgi:hypothetical protein